jgi:uncharacterized pyridoxal phosphate-containing UPF0001 family protein
VIYLVYNFICDNHTDSYFAEKGGINPEESVDVVSQVVDKFTNLKFSGLMTIGKFGYDLANGPNPDFQVRKKFHHIIFVNFYYRSYPSVVKMSAKN